MNIFYNPPQVCYYLLLILRILSNIHETSWSALEQRPPKPGPPQPPLGLRNHRAARLPNHIHSRNLQQLNPAQRVQPRGRKMQLSQTLRRSSHNQAKPLNTTSWLFVRGEHQPEILQQNHQTGHFFDLLEPTFSLFSIRRAQKRRPTTRHTLVQLQLHKRANMQQFLHETQQHTHLLQQHQLNN